MLAPSGTDQLPFATQQAVFAGAFVGLGIAAIASAAAYKSAKNAVPGVWWDRWELWSAFTLGVTFVLAGRSHFTVPEAFKSIYPPVGTWGFWYLAGSSDFHVAWTGVAELLGGSGLLAGVMLSLTNQPNGRLLLSWSARCVLLVLCVSPANIYMYTHGAIIPGIVEGDLPVGWHTGRFVAQAIVLSVLLTTAKEFDDPAAAAGEEDAEQRGGGGRRAGRLRMQLREVVPDQPTEASATPGAGAAAGGAAAGGAASIEERLKVLRRCAASPSRGGGEARPETAAATLALARVANAGVHPPEWESALCGKAWRPVFSAKPGRSRPPRPPRRLTRRARTWRTARGYRSRPAPPAAS